MGDSDTQLHTEGCLEEQEVLRKLRELELACKAREAENFVERVQEVHDTVRGLIDGTIDAAALERHEEREKWRARAKEIRKEEAAAKAREELFMGQEGKGEGKRHYTFFCRACLVEFSLPNMTQCNRCGGPLLSMKERLAQLQEKVQALKSQKAGHMTRKARWQQWLNTRKHVKKTKVVQYQTWEMWEPSTDEEEKENAVPITPAADPAFQTLEKDMKENLHKRQERRRAAIRCKERGNALLKRGDLLGALEAYEEGLEHRRDVKELWNNKALVLLKLKRYNEVCETATTLLEYCEIFEDGFKKSATLCFKAFCRRALAYRALQRWQEAVADLEQATALHPEDIEATQMLRQTRQHVCQLAQLEHILSPQSTPNESRVCCVSASEACPKDADSSEQAFRVTSQAAATSTSAEVIPRQEDEAKKQAEIDCNCILSKSAHAAAASSGPCSKSPEMTSTSTERGSQETSTMSPSRREASVDSHCPPCGDRGEQNATHQDIEMAGASSPGSAIATLEKTIGTFAKSKNTYAEISHSVLQTALDVLQTEAAARFWFCYHPYQPLDRPATIPTKSSTDVAADDSSGAVSHGEGHSNYTRGVGLGQKKEHSGGTGEKGSQAVSTKRTLLRVAETDFCNAAARLRKLRTEHGAARENSPHCSEDKLHSTIPSSSVVLIVQDSINALRLVHTICASSESLPSQANPRAESEDDRSSCSAAANTCSADSSSSSSFSSSVCLLEICENAAGALVTLFAETMSCLQGMQQRTPLQPPQHNVATTSCDGEGSRLCVDNPQLVARRPDQKDMEVVSEVAFLVTGMLYFFSFEALSRRKMAEVLHRRGLEAFITYLLHMMQLDRHPITQAPSSTGSPDLSFDGRVSSGFSESRLLSVESVDPSASCPPASTTDRSMISSSFFAAAKAHQQVNEQRDNGADHAEESWSASCHAGSQWLFACGRDAGGLLCNLLLEPSIQKFFSQQAGDQTETQADPSLLHKLCGAVRERAAALVRCREIEEKIRHCVQQLLPGETLRKENTSIRHMPSQSPAARRDRPRPSEETDQILSVAPGNTRKRHEDAQGEAGHSLLGMRQKPGNENETVSGLASELISQWRALEQLNFEGNRGRLGVAEQDTNLMTAGKQCLSILTNLSHSCRLRLEILRQLKEPLLQLLYVATPGPASSLSGTKSESGTLTSSAGETSRPSFLGGQIARLPGTDVLGLFVNLTAPATTATRKRSNSVEASRPPPATGPSEPDELRDLQINLLGDERFLRWLLPFIDGAIQAASRRSERDELLCIRSLTLASRIVGATAAVQKSIPSLPCASSSSSLRPRTPCVSSMVTSSSSSCTGALTSPALTDSRDLVHALFPRLVRIVRLQRDPDEATSAAVQLLCSLAQHTPLFSIASAAEIEREKTRRKEETERTTTGHLEGTSTSGKPQEEVWDLTHLVRFVCETLAAVVPRRYASKESEMSAPVPRIRGNLLLFLGLTAKAQIAAMNRQASGGPEAPATNHLPASKLPSGKTGETEPNPPEARQNRDRSPARPTQGKQDGGVRSKEPGQKREDSVGDPVLLQLDLTKGIFCCVEALRKDVGGVQRNAAVTLASLAQIPKYKGAIIALKGMESLMQIGVPLLLGNK